MRNTVAFLVLILAATAIVCRSSDEQGEVKEIPSWTDWAMAKFTGVFNGDKMTEAALSTPNQAGDASGSSNYVSEKTIEAEDAAAKAAKKLSDDKGQS